MDFCIGHPFLIPRRKNADDEMIPIHAKSLDDNFLEVLQQLDYPPLDDDRLNIKLRLFSKSTAKVNSLFKNRKCIVIIKHFCLGN